MHPGAHPVLTWQGTAQVAFQTLQRATHFPRNGYMAREDLAVSHGTNGTMYYCNFFLLQSILMSTYQSDMISISVCLVHMKASNLQLTHSRQSFCLTCNLSGWLWIPHVSSPQLPGNQPLGTLYTSHPNTGGLLALSHKFI